MNVNKAIKAVFFTLGMVGACAANASVTYTYTDSSDPRFTGGTNYSGQFSVETALADGTYHFLNAANQPAGFTQNFFTTSFVDARKVTRTPSISLFDITITNGLVSLWDIRASTVFSTGTCNRAFNGNCINMTYHDNATLIYHDTNVSYLPGNGLAYQSPIASGDYQTYYASGSAYQESLSGLNMGVGTWSIATTPAVSAVPLPPSIAMFAASLLGFGALGRKKLTKKNS